MKAITQATRISLVSGMLLGMLLAPWAQAEENKRYIVHYKDGSHSQVRSALVGARGNVKHQLPNMNAVAVEVTDAGARQLAQERNVVLVEEDRKRYLFSTTPSTGTPYLVGQSVPYGIKLVQADLLSDASAANRKVCIIDSGYDRTHEDLNGNTVNGEYDSGTGWWYTDENQHGTHVAGTIAAINNSGVGVVGVAPNKKLQLHIVKVFGKNGWAYSSSLAAAANKCAAAGAHVISMSLGGDGFSSTENTAFDNLAKKGIIIFAAAGNNGTTSQSYPAGYASVISVGALDVNKQWANFSQYNSKVEISAPGVAVMSTVPAGQGLSRSLRVANSNYAAGTMDGSIQGNITAALADFGVGNKVQTSVKAKVCLIARGTNTFAEKIANCQSSGGVAAVVYNNVAGAFTGTLGGVASKIPVLTVTAADGTNMKRQLGQSANVKISNNSYAAFNGTSMATPHAAAVAALVWSSFPTCSAAQIRTSLSLSAMDLGTKGRDAKFGFGLIQAKTAFDRIKSKGCGK